eukprot:1152659-Pelagomonas_calceolata.AAC.1
MENIDAHVLSKCAAKLDIGSFLQFRQSFKEARAASEDPFLWACASGCHGSETAEDTLNFIACSTKKIQILELQRSSCRRPLFAPSEDPSVLLNAFRETRSAEVVLRESHARFERGLSVRLWWKIKALVGRMDFAWKNGACNPSLGVSTSPLGVNLASMGVGSTDHLVNKAYRSLHI